MKQQHFDVKLAQLVAGIVALFIILLPFHAFLTVWASSLVGHYTALRLWKEAFLAVAAVAAVYLSFRTPTIRRSLMTDWLWRLIAAYGFVMIMWGIVAYASGAVTRKAVLYGELVDLRLFVILFVAFVAAQLVSWLYRIWAKLVLGPATLVIAIGLLQQFILPYDVMKHFGYSAATIPPYETIDHKVSYIRIRSTLRGANLLGGYLIIVMSQVLQRLIKRRTRRWLSTVLLVVTLVVLYGSGSRGAWLGAVAAAVVMAGLQFTSRRAKRLAMLGAGLCIAVLAGAVIVLRNNDYVQNTIFHTDEHSQSSVSSNTAHFDASFTAAKQVIHEPLGRGPGTAGPAGVYNTGHPARIAEDYFLQIGQEAGWLGLGLFIAVYALLARKLWQLRHLPLAQILLASFAGLTVLALLMHSWTDDTLAYLWFSLTGIALAQPVKRMKSREKVA